MSRQEFVLYSGVSVDRTQLINIRNGLAGAGRGNLGVPLLLLVMMGMMMLPVPPFLLDVLFTFNIALSIVVLLVSVYALRPLDFAVFPTILLVATLMRLALNVASTRVVLIHGHDGGSAAGHVIEGIRQCGDRRQLRGRCGGVRHPHDHQLRGGDQGCRAHLRGQRTLYRMPCRASRWRSTPT